MKRSKLVSLAALAATAGTAFVGGQLASTRPAEASATHAYVLRKGDKITIPAINQACVVSEEGRAPDLFCTRSGRSHHQVVFFRDSILVWKTGNPDAPVWSGRP
ncbi:MAG: hypothetical protein ACJ74D_12190 [Gaiellaceae bacterium]|jgi:hypothetical protein